MPPRSPPYRLAGIVGRPSNVGERMRAYYAAVRARRAQLTLLVEALQRAECGVLLEGEELRLLIPLDDDANERGESRAELRNWLRAHAAASPGVTVIGERLVTIPSADLDVRDAI
jgi:hypothetical protein